MGAYARDSTNAARCETSCTLSVNTSVFFSAAATSALSKSCPSVADASVAIRDPRMPSGCPHDGHRSFLAAYASGVTRTGTPRSCPTEVAFVSFAPEARCVAHAAQQPADLAHPELDVDTEQWPSIGGAGGGRVVRGRARRGERGAHRDLPALRRTVGIGSRTVNSAFSSGSSTLCCTQAGTRVPVSGWPIA